LVQFIQLAIGISVRKIDTFVHGELEVIYAIH